MMKPKSTGALKLSIEVSQLPPASSSPNARVHWGTRYRDALGKRGYAEAVYYECVQVRNNLIGGEVCLPFRRPVLSLTFVFPNYRERDADNLLNRFKSGQDMLVRSGLILKDDMQHLKVNRLKVVVDPSRAPLTIIELEEA
jgi:Holliday junction resolvase RusA-like endonuclease